MVSAKEDKETQSTGKQREVKQISNKHSKCPIYENKGNFINTEAYPL